MIKKHKYILILITFSLLAILAKPVSADSYMTSGSASIRTHNTLLYFRDERVDRLETYLESHNSPLAPFAETFVSSADKHNLDWRLVAAISGVESTFGKKIPYNSYNAYGWANGDYYFDSWEDSVEHVSKVLKEKYIDDGLTSINQIAQRYAPPSKSWAWKVKFFMKEIGPMPIEFTI